MIQTQNDIMTRHNNKRRTNQTRVAKRANTSRDMTDVAIVCHFTVLIIIGTTRNLNVDTN